MQVKLILMDELHVLMNTTKLKKAQSQLDKLTDDESNSDDGAALKAEVATLEQKVEQTQAHYLKHKLAQPADSQSTESDASQRQEDYEKALKLYTKAMTALDKAREQNSPHVEKMTTSIEKLKRKLDDAQAALPDQNTAANSNNDDNNQSQV